MFRTRAFRVAALLIAAVLLAWCLPAAFRGLGAKRRIQDVFVWGMALGPDDRGLLAVVKEFERRNPGTRVRVLSMGAGHMNPQKLLTAIVGGVPPDVVLQGRFNVPDWAARGAFRPLDDLIARDAADPDAPRASNYYGPVWEESSWDGHVYGIPTLADNRAFYWNKAVFREVGLDPERPPRTWSEVLEFSRKISRRSADGNLERAGFLPNFGNSWPVLFGLQNGAKFVSDDGRRIELDSPEMVEALKFMKRGYDDVGGIGQARRFQGTFSNLENDPFFRGQVAMKVDGDWFLPGIARYAPSLDFGVSTPPMPDDRVDDPDATQTWTGGWAYVIPKGAKNVEGAWGFIKFATSMEGRLLEAKTQERWERARGRLYLPRLHGMRDANAVLLGRTTGLPKAFRDGWSTHVALMERSLPRPSTVVGQALWDGQVRAFDDYAAGKAGAEKALADQERAVQVELDRILDAESKPVVPVTPLVFVAGGVLALLIGGFVWSGLGTRMRGLAKGENRWAYLFIAPWFLGLVGLTAGPILASLFLSFTQWDVLGPVRWVGLANYADLFGVDWKSTGKAFSNITQLCAIGVPLNVCTGLALAVLLNARARGIDFFRAMFYLPSIVPVVASTVLWVWILNPDPARGLVNAAWAATFTSWFGWAAPGWFTTEEWSRPGLIMMGLWGAGGGIVLWLAGLKGIPRTLYEAAELDGADRARAFRNVTLPLLSPVLFFSLVMGFIGAFQEFDRVYVTVPPDQRFGVGDSLLVPVVLLFEHGFARFQMGYASAIAWIVFVVLVAVTWLQFAFAEKRVHYEVSQ